MTLMMERMNFVMGNMCDRLDRMEKHGNEAGTSTQDVRKLGVEPKANNGNRAERPRWAIGNMRMLMIFVRVVLRTRP
jgi:hypothetical protein